jgi:hypothetical protein
LITQPKEPKATPRRKQPVRVSLTTIPGILTEMGKVYRECRAGKIEHQEARSLVWILSEMRAAVEGQAIERLHERLDEIASLQAGRAGYGQQSNNRPALTSH